MRRLRCATALVLFVTTTVDRAAAQDVRSRLNVATLSPNAATVHRIWTTYLASRLGKFSWSGTPTPLWSAAEQQRWPTFDLAGAYLDDAAVPEVLAIDSVDNAFRITTAFRLKDAQPVTWWTEMTTTVYAVREGGRWVLSTALVRNTRGWVRDTVGPITYVFAPHYPYNRARARRAVAFTDSLARAFGVPRLAPLTYYLLPSYDSVFALMGLESRVKDRVGGGLAQPINRQLFSGIPALGEEYRHELAHLVLAPLMTNASYLASEGIATWLGGTTGISFADAARALAVTLKARPTLSLDSLVARSYPSPIYYPAGAVLAEMIFEHGGTAAIQRWLSDGPAQQVSIARILERPWSDVVRDWRARVLRYAR